MTSGQPTQTREPSVRRPGGLGGSSFVAKCGPRPLGDQECVSTYEACVQEGSYLDAGCPGSYTVKDGTTILNSGCADARARYDLAIHKLWRLISEGRCAYQGSAPPTGSDGESGYGGSGGESGYGGEPEGGGYGGSTSGPGTGYPVENSPPHLISTSVLPDRGVSNREYVFSVSLSDPDGDTVEVELCFYVPDYGWDCVGHDEVSGRGTLSWGLNLSSLAPGTYYYKLVYNDGNGNSGTWGPFEGPTLVPPDQESVQEVSDEGESGGVLDPITGTIMTVLVGGLIGGALVKGRGGKPAAGKADRESVSGWRRVSERGSEGGSAEDAGSERERRVETGEEKEGKAGDKGERRISRRRRKKRHAEDSGGTNAVDQFLKSMEESNKSLVEGALRPAGSQAPSASAIERLLNKEVGNLKGMKSRKLKEIIQIQEGGGGLRNLRPKPRVEGIYVSYAPEDFPRLRRFIRWCKSSEEVRSIQKRITKLKNMARAMKKWVSPVLSGVSLTVQVYDGTSSYNHYVESNREFIGEHPFIGRMLGAAKAVGEQVIYFTVTKNPVVALSDIAVSYLTGGKVSIMGGIHGAENLVDVGTQKYAETIYEAEYGKYSEGISNHATIRNHLRKLRDPRFRKKLLERGWTEERIDRVTRDLLTGG